jgi:hypothetical protein
VCVCVCVCVSVLVHALIAGWADFGCTGPGSTRQSRLSGHMASAAVTHTTAPSRKQHMSAAAEPPPPTTAPRATARRSNSSSGRYTAPLSSSNPPVWQAKRAPSPGPSPRPAPAATPPAVSHAPLNRSRPPSPSPASAPGGVNPPPASAALNPAPRPASASSGSVKQPPNVAPASAYSTAAAPSGAAQPIVSRALSNEVVAEFDVECGGLDPITRAPALARTRVQIVKGDVSTELVSAIVVGCEGEPPALTAVLNRGEPVPLSCARPLCAHSFVLRHVHRRFFAASCSER